MNAVAGSHESCQRVLLPRSISAIHLKVDQVAAAIRSKNTEFELTFLRYVGPLRPAVAPGGECKNAEREDKTAKINLKNAPAQVPANGVAGASQAEGQESTPTPKKEENARKKSDSRCRLGAKDKGSDMEQMQEALASAQGSTKKSDKQHSQEVPASAQQDVKKKSDKQREVLASPGSKKQSDQQQRRQQQQSPSAEEKRSTEEKKRFRLFGRLRRAPVE
jgi:hypothetical protein